MYAITGATGHTGSNLVRRLLAQRQQVRAIGRDQHRLEPLVHEVDPAEDQAG